MLPCFKWTWVPALTLLASLAASPALAESNVLFTGGGFIMDGRGADAKRIGFSVNLFVDATGLGAGHLQFDFHNVDDSYGLDGSRFTATEFGDVTVETHYFPDEEGTPYTFVRIVARGRLDGEEGWSVLARFSDFGMPVRNKSLPPEQADALRLMLFHADTTDVPALYDTARQTADGEKVDFPREQSWRTLLDGGNVVVDIKLGPGS
jgi:hypothetical protein